MLLALALVKLLMGMLCAFPPAAQAQAPADASNVAEKVMAAVGDSPEALERLRTQATIILQTLGTMGISEAATNPAANIADVNATSTFVRQETMMRVQEALATLGVPIAAAGGTPPVESAQGADVSDDYFAPVGSGDNLKEWQSRVDALKGYYKDARKYLGADDAELIRGYLRTLERLGIEYVLAYPITELSYFATVVDFGNILTGLIGTLISNVVNALDVSYNTIDIQIALAEAVAAGLDVEDGRAQAQQIASLVDVVSLLVSRVPGAPMQMPHAEPARARAGHAAHSAAPRAAPAAEAAQPARPAAAAAPVASAGGGPATERPASGATRAASARGPSRRGGLPARVGDTSLRRSFVLSIPVARGANWFLAGGGRRMDEEEATAAAAERIAAAAEDGTSLPVRLATDVVRFLYGGTGRREPADGGVVSASLLNAKPAVGGIGVEPRGGGVLRVLFTVASDAVADTVVRWRHELRRCVDSTAVFDVLSDREEAQHQALWPAFLAAKVAGKRAQFHRARLVVDGERVVRSTEQLRQPSPPSLSDMFASPALIQGVINAGTGVNSKLIPWLINGGADPLLRLALDVLDVTNKSLQTIIDWAPPGGFGATVVG
ncbi:hypothetical protein FOA52_016168 [Chlamydomonas sp. UWO 241]|nr:hypothetical protein FOA52_016168 [Chlamydomonas sp. UWO 241]